MTHSFLGTNRSAEPAPPSGKGENLRGEGPPFPFPMPEGRVFSSRLLIYLFLLPRAKAEAWVGSVLWRNWFSSSISLGISVIVQSLSRVGLCNPVDSLQPHGLQHGQASLSFTLSWNLLRLMSTEWVMPSNHLILCCPLLLLASVFSSIRVF